MTSVIEHLQMFLFPHYSLEVCNLSPNLPSPQSNGICVYIALRLGFLFLVLSQSQLPSSLSLCEVCLLWVWAQIVLPLLQIPRLGVLCEERVSASTRKEESRANSSLLIRKLSWVSTPHHAQNLHSLFPYGNCSHHCQFYRENSFQGKELQQRQEALLCFRLMDWQE